MPKSIGEVHVNVPLSNVAMKYSEAGFIAELVFPVVKVEKEADKYWVFNREYLRNVDTRRAIGTPSKRVDWTASATDYTCEEEALSNLLPDRVRDNADSAVKPKITTVQWLTQWVRRSIEKQTQAIVQSTAVITNTHTPTVAWTASSGSDPQGDVNTAKTTVRRNCGRNPNTIIMSNEVALALLKYLRNTAYTLYKDFVEKAELPPRLWGLKPVVASPIEDTSAEGQTSSIADIWNDNVVVAYIEPGQPGLHSMSLGWTIRSQNFITRDWRDEESRGTVYEVSVIQVPKLVSANCGYIIADVTVGSGS